VDTRHCQQVTAGEHRIEADPARPQVRDGRPRAAFDKRCADEKRFIGSEAVFLESTLIAQIPLTDLRQLDVTKERNVASTRVEKMSGCQSPARDIVAADGTVQLL